MRIEDYGLIGDFHTAALVARNGAIEWLCLPRFDDGACFASLLGTERNGHWRIAPANASGAVQRYRPNTLVLETEFKTDGGRCVIIDFMPPADGRHDLIRIVRGLEGRVELTMEMSARFDYGETLPWLRRLGGSIEIVAGPNALLVQSSVVTEIRDYDMRARFAVGAGEEQSFVLSWFPSHRNAPGPIDPRRALSSTESFWRHWCSHCTYDGPWVEAVMRSLITLKALTYEPTGGMVAAATTSLPEQLGGVRNWDYRYCWLRDATFTLYSLLQAGYTAEAEAWSDWLLRAVAGHPAQLQMLYGAAGERSLPERQLKHLDGYEQSKPVRVGNGAVDQFQLDVYGEVMDAMHFKRAAGLSATADSWHLQRQIVDFVIQHWDKPDEGIWEVRGGRRHFTHSKVMAWVTLDRAIKAVEQFKLGGDVERWRHLRQQIHADVCAKGYNAQRGVFTQSYGSTALDASLLLMPLVGFLPVTDARVERTIRAIQDNLVAGGLVHRYRSDSEVDGLPPGEGSFLPCSFWLVHCLYLLGEKEAAKQLFESLLALRSPLGLLSEEYDVSAQRLVGNFPQAFSHVALVNSAQNLSAKVSPAEARGATQGDAARKPIVAP
jgi:GH15 family glucan-1,4-alpha-glucosidase